MSSRSDTEYSEPFRQVDAKTAASFQRPKPRSLDRVERALNGSLCETQLSEDEWDRFAAMRDQSYRNKRDWQLSTSDRKCAGQICLYCCARQRNFKPSVSPRSRSSDGCGSPSYRKTDQPGPFSQEIRATAWSLGGMGVATFFVISGFIMVYTTRDKFGIFGAGLEFIKKRIIRGSFPNDITTILVVIFHSACQQDQHSPFPSGTREQYCICPVQKPDRRSRAALCSGLDARI